MQLFKNHKDARQMESHYIVDQILPIFRYLFHRKPETFTYSLKSIFRNVLMQIQLTIVHG